MFNALTKYTALFVILAATACDKTASPLVCDTISDAGIRISLWDSISGNRYIHSAVIVARDSLFVDSVVVATGVADDVVLAKGRPGTYTVSVKAPDYMPWTADISVPQSGCSLKTVQTKALLKQDTTSTFAAYFGGRGEFFDPALVHVEFTAGSFVLNLAAPDLSPKTFVIPATGHAAVRFSLVTATHDTLGTSLLSFDLAPRWDYGISGMVGTIRPAGVCTPDVTPVTLHRSDGSASSDTLFVYLAGLPRGAIC